MQFNGQYLDTFGLYNLRAREYDPTIGQFTAVDPIRPPITDPFVSSYVYANNRPLVMSDPTGEFVFAILPIAFAAYAAASYISTGVNCYYASKTYDTGFGQEFQRDCVAGIGSLTLDAFSGGLARFGKDVPKLAGILYDELYELSKQVKRPSPTPTPPQPSPRPTK